MSPVRPSPTVFIYGLIDTRTGQLRYVGKSVNPRRRLEKHLRESRNGPRNHRECWLKGLQEAGFLPELFIIEEVLAAEWIEAEQFWIAYFRFLGCDLVNATIGGDGLQNPPPEVRAKIAAGVGAAHHGKPKSPEHREKLAAIIRARALLPISEDTRARMSTAAAQRRASEETRAKMSAIRTGRKLPPRTEEFRRKLSEANRGKTASPETRAKQSAARKGRKFSPEHAAKIGEANRGRVVSAETRAKISAQNNGRVMSEEARRKMSREFIAIPPRGQEIAAYNITRFCEEHGLNKQSVYRVLQGKVESIHGWRFRYAESQ
jgi:hypothetical protein